MRCDEFEDQVHRALDQRATPWTLEPLQQHAQTCRKCRDLLAGCEALSDGLGFFEPESLDAGFSQSVVSQLALATPRTNRARTLAIAISVVAAAVLFLLLPNILHKPFAIAPEHSDSSQTTAASHPVDGRLADAGAADVGQEHTFGDNAASVDQVTAILSEWRNRWSSDPWRSVDQLEGGIAPITIPLSIAIDELRSTIPLGRANISSEDTGDSAGTRSETQLADTA